MSSRIRGWRLNGSLVTALLAACLVAAPAQASAPVRPVQQAHHLLGPPTDPPVMRFLLTSMIRGMSLEERVGQLYVTFAYGDSADTTNEADIAQNQLLYGVDTPAQMVEKYHLGGVIYFAWSRNTNSPKQVAHLSNGLQQAATGSGAHIPLLIATDQEMGTVVRIGAPATQFPGNMPLGAGRSAEDACTAARITGQELRAMGVNSNFAPVSDVNVNPQNPVIGVRSFSEDPALVSLLASTQVRCMQRQGGIAATAKHFPGHGDTDTDSHTGLPLITHTQDEWERIDRPPFAADIRAGVDAIMTAHIVVPALDPSGDPATLSAPIINGVLRGAMHYDGLVITDALSMQGVREKYGDDRVPVLALAAGVDQLLKPPDGVFDVQYNAVLNAVRGGELTQERIDESVYRVLRLKFRNGLLFNPFVDESRVDARVGTADHLIAAQGIADRTITLVKNDAQSLPLARNSGKSVLVTGWGSATTASFATKISGRGLVADVLTTGTSPTSAQIVSATSAAVRHDLVLVVTNRVWLKSGSTDYTSQQTLVTSLLATGKPVIVVAAHVPYDIAYFPDAPTYLATYGYSETSLESLVRVLFGELNPTAKLPVTIPFAGQPGTVLYPFGYGLGY